MPPRATPPRRRCRRSGRGGPPWCGRRRGEPSRCRAAPWPRPAAGPLPGVALQQRDLRQSLGRRARHQQVAVRALLQRLAVPGPRLGPVAARRGDPAQVDDDAQPCLLGAVPPLRAQGQGLVGQDEGLVQYLRGAWRPRRGRAGPRPWPRGCPPGGRTRPREGIRRGRSRGRRRARTPWPCDRGAPRCPPADSSSSARWSASSASACDATCRPAVRRARPARPVSTRLPQRSPMERNSSSASPKERSAPPASSPYSWR